MAAIAVISLVLAGVANAAHPMRLPVFAHVPQPGLPTWVFAQFHVVDAKQVETVQSETNLLIVDARTREDYEKGHIPGAVLLSYHGFNQHYAAFAAQVPKDRPLLLYCYGTECGWAARVGKRLVVKGYTDVRILRHGMTAWKAQGFAVQGREASDE